MKVGLETIFEYLNGIDHHNTLTHFIFESRGQKEDRELEIEFKEVCDYKKLPFEIVIADKKTNSEELKFADLVARPVGISILRPNQTNRAFQMIKKKLYRREENLVYPLKAKDPKASLEVQTPVG